MTQVLIQKPLLVSCRICALTAVNGSGLASVSVNRKLTASRCNLRNWLRTQVLPCAVSLARFLAQSVTITLLRLKLRLKNQKEKKTQLYKMLISNPWALVPICTPTLSLPLLWVHGLVCLMFNLLKSALHVKCACFSPVIWSVTSSPILSSLERRRSTFVPRLPESFTLL